MEKTKKMKKSENKKKMGKWSRGCRCDAPSYEPVERERLSGAGEFRSDSAVFWRCGSRGNSV